MFSWIISLFMLVATTAVDTTVSESIGMMIVAGLFAIAGNIGLHK